ncbi:MAG: hypothetical protein NC213_06590 [Acetobacter sp.]|nr:hypothetical protein [Acetobacter sp.]
MLTYGDKTFTWTSGRNLESITDGENEYSYTYDENGIRTSKTVNGVTTYYTTKDGVILSQTDGTDTMHFQYDLNGIPLGFTYNGSQYLYMTNQIGDVIAITDTIGNIMASYIYDEWGNVKNIIKADSRIEEQLRLAKANPIRYRGYYCDAETGYYYLQSRYYDPSICRFINVDIPQIAKDNSIGLNLFTYCNDNPINNSDPSGMLAVTTCIIIGAVAGVVIGGAAGYALSRILRVPKDKRWKYVVGGAAIGAVIGACVGYAVGAAAAGSSGIVLWSGGGMNGAGGTAANFAAKNGLKTLEMTKKGKLLSAMNKAATKVLGSNKGYKFMKPFWEASSKQFVKSAVGKQTYVNVFIKVSVFSSESIFAQIEYKIVRETGMKII